MSSVVVSTSEEAVLGVKVVLAGALGCEGGAVGIIEAMENGRQLSTGSYNFREQGGKKLFRGE